MSWFDELEEITYEAFEYVPNVGKLYVFKRVYPATEYADQKRFWESAVNFVGGALRDVLLVTQSGEPVPVILIHPMTERLSDELCGILGSVYPPHIPLTQALPEYDPATHELVLLAGVNEKSDIAAARLFFHDAVKGVHYFYDSYFSGRIVECSYAPDGEDVVAHFPEGIRAGARCEVIWRWTSDGPQYTYGQLEVDAGTPVAFSFADSSLRGSYKFSGLVLDVNLLLMETGVNGAVVPVDGLMRVARPSALSVQTP